METTIEKIWTKSKVLIKAFIIGVILLILQIPTSYISDLVNEREQRQKEATEEVSSKWAKRQNIAGPVLVLPYWQTVPDSSKAAVKHFAYFLPDELYISTNVTPEEKYRGIYKVMLYTSQINIAGKFENISLDTLKIAPQDVIWNEAFVHISISDIKGLNDDLKLKWNNQLLTMTTDISDPNLNQGLSAPLNLKSINDLQRVDFFANTNIAGSEQLLFTPLGKLTSVEMSAKWPHPSFTGDILPFSTKINNDSFYAQWKSVAQKRNFPQQWKDNVFTIGSFNAANKDTLNNIASSAFGAGLYVPVNGYQKTMRSVKYAALCILLTFAAFFLIETTNKKSVHPFQYGLIGLALVLFYTLLLSFSEYIGFNSAYIISSLAVIGLITWFVQSILSSTKLSVILSVVLLLVYSYVFTILQLQDFALLLGSVGLFITLAVIMYFSRKVQW